VNYNYLLLSLRLFHFSHPILNTVWCVRWRCLHAEERPRNHRECHESETYSRRAFLLIQSVDFNKIILRIRAFGGNMG